MTYRSRGGDTGGLGHSLVQVAITHPTPDATVAVVGTADSDLDPGVHAASYIPVLNEYAQTTLSGTGFSVEADGRVKVLQSGVVQISAYADVAHSNNNSTVGAVFSITRGAGTILSARAVHTKVPNNGDIGNIAGVGIYEAVAGDLVGIALASDTTGNVSIRASGLVFRLD